MAKENEEKESKKEKQESKDESKSEDESKRDESKKDEKSEKEEPKKKKGPSPKSIFQNLRESPTARKIFWTVLGVSFVYILSTIEYSNVEVCIGAGFTKKAVKYGTGQGRCEKKWSLATSLRKRAFYISYLAYQGDFIDGRMEGKGLYTRWTAFNQYNLQVYEGENKVQYDGLWQNELREGSGYFHLPEGIHYNGNWTNNKLTGNNNKMSIRRDPHNHAESKYFRFHMEYAGETKDCLMHGKGSILGGKAASSNDEKATLEGEFNEGVLVKADNIKIAQNEFKITELDDKLSGTSHPCKMKLSHDGKQYSWDGSSLTYDQTSLNLKSITSGAAHPPVEIGNLVEFLDAFCTFETTFLQKQDFTCNYKFETFQYISQQKQQKRVEL